MRGAGRRRLAAGALIALLAFGASPSGAHAADALAVREIARGVFVHEGRTLPLDVPGHDDIANIGFVVGERCVAVIDTGGSLRIGRALRAAVRTHTRRPVCYVIDTHVHVDHVLGNAAFRADKPAFVGSARLAAAIAGSRRFFVQQYPGDFDAPASEDQVVGPDLLVETTRELDLGGRRLSLRAWPVAHTDSDLTVLVDDVGVLWTGDLLFRERVPALDGSAKGWLAAIDEIAKMKVKLVVPGHGPVADDLAAALAPERRYLQDLVDDVRKAIAAGTSIDEAMRHAAERDRAQWQLWDTAHPHNVSQVYRELEWE